MPPARGLSRATGGMLPRPAGRLIGTPNKGKMRETHRGRRPIVRPGDRATMSIGPRRPLNRPSAGRWRLGGAGTRGLRILGGPDCDPAQRPARAPGVSRKAAPPWMGTPRPPRRRAPDPHVYHGVDRGAGRATTSVPQTAPTPSPPTNESNGGTNASPGTRTAPAPQFTEHESSAAPLSLSAAEQLLVERGYRATETSGYRSEQALSVLTGAGTAGEHAFFFTRGAYLGTDASEPSRSITVVSHSGSEVTLAYGLYGLGGAAAGTAQVRFKLEDGKLRRSTRFPRRAPGSSPAAAQAGHHPAVALFFRPGT